MAPVGVHSFRKASPICKEVRPSTSKSDASVLLTDLSCLRFRGFCAVGFPCLDIQELAVEFAHQSSFMSPDGSGNFVGSPCLTSR